VGWTKSLSVKFENSLEMKSVPIHASKSLNSA